MTERPPRTDRRLMMNIKITMDRAVPVDSTATARQQRFGALPPRITYAEMTEEKPDGPQDRASDGYNPEASWMHFSCLALDLGL
ncbi:hypothetical protein V2S66_29695 [Streptomyces sp. V4-01]|uniref:Uncharacterized protein n=1 Tax=Actinacidiphila polyblastidii TaxID=3110430 RepID=A0ABU7PM46_9ACTN|nr:hypothetical protein [Streptomyces sp. V4-01]